MSASNEWTEWHLTPRGWVEGNEQMDFGNEKSRPTPPDRVLTVTWHEYLSSAYSKMDRYHSENWRSSDEAAVKALLAKFGEPPKHL